MPFTTNNNTLKWGIAIEQRIKEMGVTKMTKADHYKNHKNFLCDTNQELKLILEHSVETGEDKRAIYSMKLAIILLSWCQGYFYGKMCEEHKKHDKENL